MTTTQRTRKPAGGGTRDALLGSLLAGLMVSASTGTAAGGAGEAVSLFDGKTLAGWNAVEESLWRVEGGAITGGSLEDTVEQNSFLMSDGSYADFELTLQLRLRGTEGFINAGIQVRSERLPGSNEVIGYQVDAGDEWWGKLYDESRRNRVIAEAADLAAVAAAVVQGGWNEYRIRCVGPRIQSWINGVPAVDYVEDDPGIPLAGRIGLQVHGEGKALVQVKDLRIVELSSQAGEEK